MKKFVLRAVLAAFFLFPYSVHAIAKKRVALIIGIERYSNLSVLNNPVRDAEAVSNVLRDHGFDVAFYKNLDYAGFKKAVDGFVKLSQGADEALIFYSGHGMGVTQEGQSTNVLAPTDADIDCKTRRAQKVVALEEILVRLAHVPKKVALFDACRNDPFPQCAGVTGRGYGFQPLRMEASEDDKIAQAGNGKASKGIGVSASNSQSSLLVAYSSDLGGLALDGAPGKNSPFAEALLAELGSGPKTPFRDLLDKTSSRVANLTGFQIPWVVTKGGEPEMCLVENGCEYRQVLNCQKTLAKARQLATRAEQEIDSGQPVDGVLLALEAIPDEVATAQCGWTPEPLSAAIRGQRFIRELLTVPSGGSYAGGALLSPDGNTIATTPTKEKGRASFFDRATGKVRAEFDLEGQIRITPSAFSPDGREVIYQQAGLASIFSVETGKRTASLGRSGNRSAVYDLQFSPDMVRLVSNNDGNVQLWDRGSKLIRQISMPERYIVQTIFHPTAGYFLTLAQKASPGHTWQNNESGDISIDRWAVEDGAPMGTIAHLDDGMMGAAFSHDGARLAVPGEKITILDVGTGKIISRLDIGRKSSGAVKLAFFRDDARIIVCSAPGALYSLGSLEIWNTWSGAKLHALSDRIGGCSNVGFSPFSETVLIPSTRGSSELFDATTGTKLGDIKTGISEKNGVAAVSADLQGRIFLTNQSDETARLWDARRRAERGVFQQAGVGMYAAATNPLRDQIATVTMQGAVHIWKRSSSDQLSEMHTDVGRVRYAPDGKSFITTSYEPHGGIKVWDGDTGKLVRSLNINSSGGGPGDASFSSEGERLVVAYGDGAGPSHSGGVAVIDYKSGRELAQFKGHTEVVREALFGLGGTKIVSVSDDNTVRIWDAADPLVKPIILTGPPRWATSISIDSSGSKLLTYSYNGIFRLWDIRMGVAISEPRAIADHDIAGIMTPDGQFLITGSDSGDVKMWDIDTGRFLFALKGHTARVAFLSFDQKGEHLLTASYDGTVRMWPIFSTVQDYVSAAQQAVPRCFTPFQRQYYELDPKQPEWCTGKWPPPPPVSSSTARK